MKNLEQFKKLNRTELSVIKGGEDNRQPEPIPFRLCPQCYITWWMVRGALQ
ncbi:ComC/BlpC family leader-containing pheromone/bacteriocin [Aquimarina sp. D1M17]|uniref:ComC/BlpC family leader-containing pheromone/bacteriocin n=1 Tax=Aquimarina acroporae TaxID=2937283 RepID=UPI0020BE3FB1|nr:ComC/BlpC family leader-containing pheromone/bacteriocin [Aquimarina acroporae]MCK8523618.1 ComC/BlpC family leader-containing pheromone/bacteriocin [Aquimarina acroporae]